MAITPAEALGLTKEESHHVLEIEDRIDKALRDSARAIAEGALPVVTHTEMGHVPRVVCIMLVSRYIYWGVGWKHEQDGSTVFSLRPNCWRQ